MFFPLLIFRFILFDSLFLKKIIVFIFGCAGSSLLQGFSLAEVSGGCTPVAVHGLLIVVASLLAEHGLWDVWISGAVV